MVKEVTVYHGSPHIVEEPQYGLGNPNNDYGSGFYCTQSLELAKEWACSVEADGYANRYILDMNGLSVLSLTGGEYHILNWLSVLLENRKFRVGSDMAKSARAYILDEFGVDYKKYDVIKGYRADDSYFSFATAFLNGTLSLAQLERAMRLGKLGEQIVVRSENAFAAITFQEAISAEGEIYYPKKLARDTEARAEFKGEKKRGFDEKEVYVLDILRERWKDDDERLQRVILG